MKPSVHGSGAESAVCAYPESTDDLTLPNGHEKLPLALLEPQPAARIVTEGLDARPELFIHGLQLRPDLGMEGALVLYSFEQ